MSFLRSVAVLVSGTALGHGITAAVLPVLSRLYAPADFSVLAVFAALVSIISVAACLRFDVAIALPEQDQDALTLVVLSLGLAALVSACLWLLVLLAPQWIATQLNQPALQPYLGLVPLSVLLAGGYNALQMWFVRQKRFPLIARNRVAQSLGGAGVQVGAGWLSLGPVGLLIGHAMNSGVACLFLGYRLLADRQQRSALRAVDGPSMRTLWRTYDRFPKYSSFEALCNNASVQLPVIMIAALAAPAEAGYLMMATYVMQAPMALIGVAVGQVYLSRAAEEHRSGALGRFTADVLAGLVKTGVGPLLAVGIVAPAAFGLVFGVGWERAGLLVAWMTPWFILQFITTPVSMGLHVTGHQRLALGLQVTGLLLRVAMVWMAARWSPGAIAEWYAVSGAVFYGLYLAVVMAVTGTELRRLVHGGLKSAAIVLLCLVLALAAHFLLRRL